MSGSRAGVRARIAAPVALPVVGLVSFGVLLSGCARPAPDARQAGNLGTMVCVVNQSSKVPTVNFTLRDTGTNGPVSTGGQACGEGTMGAGKNDVEGEILFPAPLKSMTLYGNNPWIGAPGAWIHQMGGNSCAGYEGMDVGQAVAWDDGVVRYVVKRESDGQWKQFTITITDSQKPSADGQPANCPNSPGAPAAA